VGKYSKRDMQAHNTCKPSLPEMKWKVRGKGSGKSGLERRRTSLFSKAAGKKFLSGRKRNGGNRNPKSSERKTEKWVS